MFTYQKPPQTIKPLIKQAYAMYQGSLAHVVWLALLASIFNILIELAGKHWYTPMLAAGHKGMGILVLLVTLLVALLCTGITSLAIWRFMHQRSLDQGEALSVSLSYAFDRKHLFRLIATMSLVYLIIVVGFMVYILPGIIALIFLVPVFPLAIAYERRPIQAIKDSCKLVYRNFATTVCVAFWPAVVLVVVMSAVNHVVPLGLMRDVIAAVISTVILPWSVASTLVVTYEFIGRDASADNAAT